MLRVLSRCSSIALQRDAAVFDVCVVGAGPAGLAAAIKLKQLRPETQVCVLDKAAEIGAHTVGGGLFDPRALHELFPNWEHLDSPVTTKLSEAGGLILTDTGSIPLPKAGLLHKIDRTGLYMVSQHSLVKWLAKKAIELGVSVYPSLSASELAFSSFGSVIGVIVKDTGVKLDGSFKPDYKRGVEVRAKQTLISEGCRGHLAEQLIDKFRLREWGSATKEEPANQTYGLGMKEVWRLPDNSKAGKLLHTFNWPLESDCFGWGFLHWIDMDLHAGFIMSLDYYNPYLDPQKEFQRFKTHPEIRHFFESAECRQFSGKAVNLGGYYSLPRVTFPGGMLLGCSAGFYNPAKAEGVNNAIKSGLLAAQAVTEGLQSNKAAYVELKRYEELVETSWLHEDLIQDRNYRQYFSRNLWVGIPQAWFSFKWLKGKQIFINNERRGKARTNADITDKAEGHTPPAYPEPDNKISFDKETCAKLARVYHEPDQPEFIKQRKVPIENIKGYIRSLDHIEVRVCPVGVFDTGSPAQCIHCKACDIKVPNLQWGPPEGGEGPFYEA